ncbi:MAG: arginase family protein [Candidatus Dojkabacteria bacterium]|nr:arginase family protein [Candidatus Dojkabacteria bacterium]
MITILNFTKNYSYTPFKIKTDNLVDNINSSLETLKDGNPYFLNYNPIEKIENLKDINLNKIYDENIDVFYAKFFEIIKDVKHNFFIGGNHFISYLLTRYFSKKLRKKLSLVCFDAHHDLWDETPKGKKYTNGTWLRRSIEEGYVDPQKTFIFGVRSVYTKESKEFLEKNKINVFHSYELMKSDPESIFDTLLSKIDDDPCYFSFDLDFFDPSIASAVLFPEPMGLDFFFVRNFFEKISENWFSKKINFVCYDFVEYCPNLDTKNLISAITLVNVFLLCLCYENMHL